ncbi:SixA phosphatase family protein [Microvirga antarctica]|uniref:SixA phosphatase family protein n=1 Tax=Microvirga antarctica TaxID=2819233 RepID=UPI001B302F2C|nr:histidine phosphatase family protein [Microvirga antarctica]
MVRLLLMRHAKSSWPSGIPDVDRPLSARGRKAAVLMGDYLDDEELSPDLVLVSPARRTQETWSLVQPALGPVAVRTEPRIYDAPASRLLSMLQEIEPLSQTVLVIGHNPGFEDLARLLASHGSGEAMSRMRQKYPTAGLAVIDCDCESWADVKARGGKLDRFVTPKTLGAGEDD